ncbi:TetR/AcrR family transcriptional regulator [Naumannella cuiyingiana]|uniref:AcrR family transcriptional regulator n=1 Tax=Naumannella cuiyingiana TaxID=1347891 RepID=A0A7Z0D8Y4_9ACTN|nr:TetR/AcrR family transcriptional regulator [Naumannella cuiyingiana]NYI71087.1 AcrR family transcriptional regulator [Naumannella cuiyingiana]
MITETSSRGPGERAGLTRAAVIGTASRLLTERGGPGVSMRAVARELGVAPNALYSHVRDKDDLLDAVLDASLAGIRPPRKLADPRAGLTTIMKQSFGTLLRHPELVPIFLARQGSRGPNAVRLGVAMDALLARAGVADPDQARLALITHAIGTAALVRTDADAPLSIARVRRLFETSLGWLLDGILGHGSGTVRD